MGGNTRGIIMRLGGGTKMRHMFNPGPEDARGAEAMASDLGQVTAVQEAMRLAEAARAMHARDDRDAEESGGSSALAAALRNKRQGLRRRGSVVGGAFAGDPEI